MVVLFEPARSAEPPHSSGMHRAERLEDLAGRGAGGDRLARLEDRELRPPSPRAARPAAMRSNSAARSGLRGAPLGEALLPRGLGLDGRGRAPARVCARTSSATSKVCSGSKPRTRLVAATSSSPSAEPCAASVFCAFGAGQAMIVRIAMNDGLSVSALRRLERRRTGRAGRGRRPASGSTRCTCQPYASYRLRMSSENGRLGVALDGDVVVVAQQTPGCRASGGRPARTPRRSPCPPAGSRRRRSPRWCGRTGRCPAAASGSNRPRS